MPPLLPKTPMEREELWYHPGNEMSSTPVSFSDPLKPAEHLDSITQSRISQFPGISNLLKSRFGLSRDTDHHWFPVRPLGKGGFGGVAVWERRNIAGDVVEETAVKQSKWSRRMALQRQPYLAKEAAIMQQLNKEHSDNIVYLKSFKYFLEQEKKKGTWRFYFEYCPYGDVSRLAKRYKAWGTYLPEEFLWKAFHSMALVAQVMEDGQYDDLETRTAPKEPYVLIHSDIKPLNIFLGYHTDPKSPWHKYPVLKVGDWGLASFTSTLDPNNPGRFMKQGTAWYLPPESRPKRVIKKYQSWENPPFNLASFTKSELERTGYDPDYTDRIVNSSHNVWGFGMTMWQLLTHETPKSLSDGLDNITEDQYNAWGQNTIPTITTHKDPEYSHELRDLVRKCLNLRPSLRPTVKQILEVTGAKMEEYEDLVAKTNRRVKNRVQQANYTYQLPRLYFKENEINSMPLGSHLDDFGFDHRYQAAFAFEEDEYARPVWGPLQHPNRALWGWRYEQLVQMNKEKQQNANGKRALDDSDTDPSGAVIPQPKIRLPKQPRRLSSPSEANMQPRGLDRLSQAWPDVLRNPQAKPAPVKRGGFIAVNTPRARAMPQDAGKQEDVMETIAEQLLASVVIRDSKEHVQNNVRNKRMRLWNDGVPNKPAEQTDQETTEGNIPSTDY